MNSLPGNRSDTSYGEGPSDLNVWISQRDMTIAQWAFIGLILLFPEKCGLHCGTRKDFAAIIYVWRVISYLIGTKDEYNMCLDSVDDTIALAGLVYRDIYYPVLSAEIARAPQGHQMALDIMKSLSSVFCGIDGQIIFNYWYDCMGIDKIVELSSWWDKMTYCYIKFLMKSVSYYGNPIFNWHGNTMQSFLIKSHANRSEIVANMPEEDKIVKFVFSSI
ncbi:hypothetical protein HDE_08279 [Halotydeus destructor]|nr:hypothetical protein HDE_08279 [Halotydeus destructor]